MAASANENLDIEKTEFGPGKTPLYYNNVGLFSDPFLEERLPNIEKYYSTPSTKFLNDYWNIDEFDAVRFNRAFQDIMDLWVKLDKDIPKFCANERQLQNRWIDKIFEYLGWTIELEETVSRHGTTNFPDYGLYKDFNDLSKSKDLKNKFKKALAVADAKAWGINLDGKGFSNKNPSYQIINYLKQTDKSWGILTDGRYWRIYSVRSDSKHSTYYEIDLIKILRAGDYERFKYFFNFFRVEAFESQARLSDRCFLDFVFEDGQFYSQRVENNLQERVYKVVDSICQGFLGTYSNPSEDELEEVYEYSMYYLFKLMFVLNCESKGLLEVNKQDDYYEFSLRKKCMDIKSQFEDGKNWSGQPRTYNYINDLFELLKHGDEKIGVHGFGDEPFEIGSEEFYIKHKISDENLNNALLELACDYDDEDNLQFIDYKILSPDHIGSLFEGLLEFNLVKKGKGVCLLNTKGDRKATGSYYTPDYLVDYIVEETLSPLVGNKNPKELLELRILDPSMGSGHFLLGVVKYLEAMIVSLQDSDKKVRGAIDFDKIRKAVLKNCVFGVDINPLATQLAKFSLWIYTSQKGDVLEPLYDQLITGNSLIDDVDWSKDFEMQIADGKVDAIVGNPPYIGEKGNKEIFHEVKNSSLGQYFQGKMDYFYFFFHKSLDLLKEDGVAGIVSTNYFGTALGGSKLRSDLKERASIFKIINFNQLKIFKGAQGQHNQVTFLKKSDSKKDKCEIYYALKKGGCSKDILDEIINRDKGAVNFKVETPETLYDGEENYLRTNVATGAKSSKHLKEALNKICANGEVLIDIADVKTGLRTGLDRVSQKHLKEFPKFSKNQGIFVISADELKENSLKVSKYIKPLFKNSDISQFSTKNSSEYYVFYISKNDKLAKDSPEIMYLKKYKPIIDSVRWNEPIPWYSIVRPRKREQFEGEKIVCPQRSNLNTFGFDTGNWFASSDVYYIKSKNKSFSNHFLLGYLNSKINYLWLYIKGKRKGKALELYQKPLSEIVVPNLSKDAKSKIENLSKQLIKKYSYEVHCKIDEVIFKDMKLSNSVIEAIEEFYSENTSSEDLVEEIAS